MEDISVDDLRVRMRNQKPYLIDVREVYEHEEFNIGGVLIPLAELTTSLDKITCAVDDEIVVYCRSGNRSGIAKTLLNSLGYPNVRNLLGGMVEWQENSSDE